MANFLLFHAYLKAIKAFDPVKKVSVIYLLRFFAESCVKVDAMVSLKWHGPYISSRFIYSKIFIKLLSKSPENMCTLSEMKLFLLLIQDDSCRFDSDQQYNHCLQINFVPVLQFRVFSPRRQIWRNMCILGIRISLVQNYTPILYYRYESHLNFL